MASYSQLSKPKENVHTCAKLDGSHTADSKDNENPRETKHADFLTRPHICIYLCAGELNIHKIAVLNLEIPI